MTITPGYTSVSIIHVYKWLGKLYSDLENCTVSYQLLYLRHLFGPGINFMPHQQPYFLHCPVTLFWCQSTIYRLSFINCQVIVWHKFKHHYSQLIIRFPNVRVKVWAGDHLSLAATTSRYEYSTVIVYLSEAGSHVKHCHTILCYLNNNLFQLFTQWVNSYRRLPQA